MLGPGEYDDLCTYVREQAKAQAAIVIVLRGEHGHGFSVQVEESLLTAEGLQKQLPEVLRKVAQDIENDLG